MFKGELKKSLLEVLKQLQIELPEEKVILEHPADLSRGDFSTSIALVLSKKLGKPPRNLADKIEKAWQKVGYPGFVEKIEVAGVGFLNIWIKLDAFGTIMSDLPKDDANCGRAGKSAITKNSVIGQKTVVIDYSSPNIAKPFGIGHLRSTNIGQALYNIYKFCGWETIGDNHLGDWGTQFGKLIYMTRVKEQESIRVEELTIEELEKLYVEFHEEAESKPEMEDEARKWFKKLEEGEAEAKAIWQTCVDVSLKEFDRIYDLLGIKIDFTYGESFYQDKMEEVLADCRKQGILKESQKATVVEIPGEKIPAMLVKSDGATTYLLRDLATIKFRKKTWDPDLYIYEVGADQQLHFKQLFTVAQMLGYGKLSQFVHVSHGLIRWSTGKFSTRKGDTIHLEDVLNEAIKKAKKLCESAGVAKGLSKEERQTVAKSIGIGAIKYNDLKQNPKTDVIFGWEQILSLSGNSGPYLQYTYARTQSVLGKVQRDKGAKVQSFIHSVPMNLCTFVPEEIILLRTLYKFPEIVYEAAKEFSPNLLCNFLFDLAQKFNLFYDKHRILTKSEELIAKNYNEKLKTKNGNEVTDEQSNFRLMLTVAVGQIIKNGLELLGIEALEKM